MKNTKITEPHPLETIVWLAFAEKDYQDPSSLALFLAGGLVIAGDQGLAYKVVARDVLLFMQAQGKLKRDGQGWWRPARTSQPKPPGHPAVAERRLVAALAGRESKDAGAPVMAAG
jgi:hypothetical protein